MCRSLVTDEFLNGYVVAELLSFGVRLDDGILSPPDDPGALCQLADDRCYLFQLLFVPLLIVLDHLNHVVHARACQSHKFKNNLEAAS